MKLNKKKPKAQCGNKSLQFVSPPAVEITTKFDIMMELTFDSLKPNGLCKWGNRMASFTLMACFIDFYLTFTQQMVSHQCSPQKCK